MSTPPGVIRESAKQRALRIPLDYHRHPTRLQRTKWVLTILAALLGGAYALWVVYGGWQGSPSAARQFSPGPVAAVHSVWNDRCETCHTPGQPLRADSSGIRAVLSALVGNRAKQPDQHSTSNDHRCQTCHSGAAHHPSQRDMDVQSCAACHRDHQGADHRLAKVEDATCVACHADIATHGRSDAASTSASVNVPSWREHPKFAPLAKPDPSRLKFNHQLHLMPGQFARGAKPTAPTRLGDLPRAEWSRLGFASTAAPDTVVHLDCTFCHELQRSTPSPSGTVAQEAPSSGAHMLPIRYERHCAACHASDLGIPSLPGKSPDSPPVLVPHGLASPAIHQLVRGAMTSHESEPPQLTPKRPIPGKTPGENLAQTLPIDSELQAAQALRELQQEHRCGKCHEFTTTATDLDQLPPDQLPLKALEVLPPSLPSVWLTRAWFDHTAHRAVRCAECHATAAPNWFTPNKPPLDHKTPMIPNIDNCQQCHGPRPDRRSGVAADCTTCHRYHGADLGPQGRGAPARAPAPDRKHSISEFLTGRATDPPATRGGP